MEAKQDRKLAVDIDLTGDELLAAVGARRSSMTTAGEQGAIQIDPLGEWRRSD